MKNAENSTENERGEQKKEGHVYKTEAPPAALPENLPLEDMVMKRAIQYFGDVMLPFLGIHQKVEMVTPTEQVYLELKRLNEDYNFATEDGSWIHLEFESDSIKKEDLRRFRSYEALTSYTYHVSVTTYVICSSTVKKIQSRLTEGINIYRVKVVRLKSWNADRLFENLFQKKQCGETIQREDIIPVLAAPLMSGTMTTTDRIINGNRLLKDITGLTKEEVLNMQAVLYALANKFLNKNDLSKVKEVLSMTKLGEMLLQDGIEQGRGQGIEAMVLTLQELGLSHSDTLKKLQERFFITEDQAVEYMNKFWDNES